MNSVLIALGYIFIIVYVIALLYITIFCLLQFHLLYLYRRKQKSYENKEPDFGSGEIPVVTIQLPIFNEMYVVERLIDNIVEIEYPRDKLEIQILDDSTDETLEISRKKVKEYSELGIDIKLVHRKDRSGYKAGALQYGMQQARGSYFAIFDADFLPPTTFLKDTLPYFNNAKSGCGADAVGSYQF